MAGSNRYKLAHKLLSPYAGQLIHVNDLRLLILKNMATSEKHINAYLTLMRDTGLITEEESLKFRIKDA